jgi:hypothetical protein
MEIVIEGSTAGMISSTDLFCLTVFVHSALTAQAEIVAIFCFIGSGIAYN